MLFNRLNNTGGVKMIEYKKAEINDIDELVRLRTVCLSRLLTNI